jgi:hypothetical protein
MTTKMTPPTDAGPGICLSTSRPASSAIPRSLVTGLLQRV